MDPADIFSELFGGAGGFHFGFGGPGGGGGRRTRRGEDSVIPYEVTLEDLYNGKHVKMNMEKEIVCGSCSGCVTKSYNFIYVLTQNTKIGCEGRREAKAVYQVRRKGMDHHNASSAYLLHFLSRHFECAHTDGPKCVRSGARGMRRLRGLRRETAGERSVRLTQLFV